jgi:cellulose synthase/poly-beta-1,6-N-acetylglucosamine synthase-like glycosyltransferase
MPSRRPARTTITIPSYDDEGTIVEAVESALAQTVGDLEIVVVDDGSRVPVADVLSEIRDARLRVIRAPHGGQSRARNIALANVRTPLMSHLDADDLWEPDYLEHILPFFDDPAIGLAYPNMRTFGLLGSEGPYIHDPERHPVDRFPELARGNPVPNAFTLRTDALRAIGGYPESVWGAQDWWVVMMLAADGWRFAYVDRMLARYRWQPSSLSNDWDKVQSTDLLVLWRFMLKHPTVPGPHARIARLAAIRTAKRVPGLRRLRRTQLARRRARLSRNSP